jgi:hypothetical protein
MPLKAPYNKIKEQGEEAEAADKGKCDKFVYKYVQHGHKFTPISFETQGQWSKDTKCLFKSIISQISSNTHMHALNLLLIGFVKFLLLYKLLCHIISANPFTL